MNPYDVDAGEFESVDSFLFRDSDSEQFDYTDSWERRGGRNRLRPVPTSKGRPLAPQRGGAAPGNMVTQAQLDAALARARTEIAANATAIKTVDGRVRTSISDMQRLQSITRKDMDKLQSDLRTTQTLSALLPMLSESTKNQTIKKLAPLVHLLPSGTLSGTSSGGSGAPAGNSLLGGNNNNLIAIAAIAFAAKAFD